jgi:TPR repeat protein
MKYILCFAAILAAPAYASDQGGGDLNPPEMNMSRVMRNIDRGEIDMMTCASGYFFTKKGDHEDARRIFELCANKGGYTAAMNWMGYMDNNGLGDEYNPDAAAAWDKRSAELGDPVGQFNYGLDLLRGHGVAQDPEMGRRYVDMAADAGLPIAKRLQGAEYDPEEVTPDADNWKYAPMF